jgi:hypothetical protein
MLEKIIVELVSWLICLQSEDPESQKRLWVYHLDGIPYQGVEIWKSGESIEGSLPYSPLCDAMRRMHLTRVLRDLKAACAITLWKYSARSTLL